MNIKAACISSVGNVREKNEDNLFFNGRYLPQDNDGIKHPIGINTFSPEALFCVYDGMGGHEAGEVASFIAASETGAFMEKRKNLIFPPRKLLTELTLHLNDSIFGYGDRSTASLPMGTTGVMLCFSFDNVYVCNVGDSPAFRLRDNELLQLSFDHVETLPAGSKRKPRLTQSLGMNPDEITLEPYIGKCKIKRGDQYLICSDGLTDMVSKTDICAILKSCASTKKAVETLLKTALENGGKDNVTVILCRVR